jgi:hypothetical protein
MPRMDERTPFERRLKCFVLENCRVGDPDW